MENFMVGQYGTYLSVLNNSSLCFDDVRGPLEKMNGRSMKHAIVFYIYCMVSNKKVLRMKVVWYDTTTMVW